MNIQPKAPCKQCPFRRKSVRGYLGSETIESFEPHVHGEVPWACHMSIKGKPTRDDGTVDTRLHGNACTGAIMCATLSCKSYRPGPLAEVQQKLRSHPAMAAVMDWWEFVKHHGRFK